MVGCLYNKVQFDSYHIVKLLLLHRTSVKLRRKYVCVGTDKLAYKKLGKPSRKVSTSPDKRNAMKLPLNTYTGFLRLSISIIQLRHVYGTVIALPANSISAVSC